MLTDDNADELQAHVLQGTDAAGNWTAILPAITVPAVGAASAALKAQQAELEEAVEATNCTLAALVPRNGRVARGTAVHDAICNTYGLSTIHGALSGPGGPVWEQRCLASHAVAFHGPQEMPSVTPDKPTSCAEALCAALPGDDSRC